jgi:hypothetical protein
MVCNTHYYYRFLDFVHRPEWTKSRNLVVVIKSVGLPHMKLSGQSPSWNKDTRGLQDPL